MQIFDVAFHPNPNQVGSKNQVISQNHNPTHEGDVYGPIQVLPSSHFFSSHEIFDNALFRTGGEICVKPLIDFLHSSYLVWKNCV